MQGKYTPTNAPEETIGRRIARLRQEQGWTQQSLSARLAISRVAVSHIEMDLTLPSERTVTLLAGLFKRSPYELVEGTTYPQAKSERLPEMVCCYTQLELEIALLHNDLEWLRRLAGIPEEREIRENLRRKWRTRLGYWGKNCFEVREQVMIATAMRTLAAEINKKE